MGKQGSRSPDFGAELWPLSQFDKKNPNLTKSFFCSPSLFHIISDFFPGRPASQTHNSHKGRMILNHESPAGRIKNCGE